MTIYDIAREAGVSASSVSRVLNKKPGVNKQKRQTIERLLEQYHYAPDAAARGLVTKASRLIGIMIEDIRNMHLSEGTYHIAKKLYESGYASLIVNASAGETEWPKEILMLEQRKVDALVLMGSRFECHEVREAILSYMPDTPVFMLNGHIDLPNIYSVLNDEKSGVRDCVRLMIRNGKKKIAFLTDNPLKRANKQKAAGYREALAEYLGDSAQPIVYAGLSESVESGMRTTMQAFSDHPDLDGIMCSLDIIACGAVQALHALGKKIPADVSVIGVDNSTYAEICSPRLTSLDNMIFDSSIQIAHKLLDLLRGETTNHQTILLTSIMERETS